jgi:hypothetical protein
VIKREIIDAMAQLRIECHELHQSLLVGEYTELTALYWIITRLETTDLLKDFTQTGAQSTAPQRRANAPIGLPPVKRAPRVLPIPGRPVPFPGGGGARRMTSPATATIDGRRLSRPIAI